MTDRNEFSRQPEWLAQTFEAKRAHPRSVAYRMLGSRTEADDAVQEAWLRLSRSNADEIENLGGWLTTIVAHICLDMLRSPTAKWEGALDVPDGAIAFDDRSYHIRRTSFVRVMTDQLMQKEAVFQTENDWLLGGYGMGSVSRLLSGGTAQFVRQKETVEAIMRLGYPAYSVAILGFWKVLGGIALLAPRFPRLKEWDCAGAFFDLTGAAASHVVCGSATRRVVMTVVLGALALISWALWPSRQNKARVLICGRSE